mmetsp:Transcript_8916/g.18806  ORF Transcript_8916/g.18806 Transcript_8916/m.18806 type:complete len:139 (+) Transcript_8916:29-445(+)
MKIGKTFSSTNPVKRRRHCHNVLLSPVVKQVIYYENKNKTFRQQPAGCSRKENRRNLFIVEAKNKTIRDVSRGQAHQNISILNTILWPYRGVLSLRPFLSDQLICGSDQKLFLPPQQIIMSSLDAFIQSELKSTTSRG